MLPRMRDDPWVFVCRRCGHTELVGTVAWRPTMGTGCPACHNLGCIDVLQAVRVDAVVAPAEVYPWTPYLERRTARRRVLPAVDYPTRQAHYAVY